MDRSLSANNRYRLNESAASNNDGKLFIFVKLTDSCMKTIETSLKQNKKSNGSNKSNIKFNLNGGEISIPTNNGEKKVYSFQISPENKTPEVFQCIQQINKNQLESCGIIEQRVNIHAQEDVYNTAREKATEFQKIEDSTKKHPTTNQILASDRPLRERLVHLLAAKQYKKPELLVRLKLDGGIRDDEKEQLDSLLSLISTQSKSGEYIILKNILTTGEVNYDWPFYPKAEASGVRKKIKDLQANVNRSTINKTTNDNRPSSSFNSTKKTSTKINNLTTNDERNQFDNDQTIISTQNPLTDQRMQQLSDMLDKLTNAVSQSEKSEEELTTNENEEDLDEAEREYNRLVSEYNRLIDYLKSISDKFSLLEQQFNEDQNNEKAKKIVDEFFQCENEDGFFFKRQRVLQLHFKLKDLQRILERNSSSNHFDFSEDEN